MQIRNRVKDLSLPISHGEINTSTTFDSKDGEWYKWTRFKWLGMSYVCNTTYCGNGIITEERLISIAGIKIKF